MSYRLLQSIGPTQFSKRNTCNISNDSTHTSRLYKLIKLQYVDINTVLENKK